MAKKKKQSDWQNNEEAGATEGDAGDLNKDGSDEADADLLEEKEDDSSEEEDENY